MTDNNDNRMTFRSFLLGVIFSALFAVISVYCINRNSLIITSTQIPVMSYALLFLMVLAINPICRLIKFIRPFSVAEILVIFVMGMVSSGISSFGLSAQLIPISSSLFNDDWYSEQAKWNQHITPYVNDAFFVAEDGLQEAAQAYVKKVHAADATRKVYEAALVLQRAQQSIVAAEAELAETDKDDAIALNRAQSALAGAKASLREAEEGWAADKPKDGDETCETVVETYPSILEKQDAETAEVKEVLAELEKKAFAKVEVFRTGLPRELRAFPGFFPTDRDTFAIYKARFKRLVKGRASLRHVAAAEVAIDAGQLDAVPDLLARAREELVEVADDEVFGSQLAELESGLKTITEERVSTESELEGLYSEQRMASGDKKDEISGRVAELAAVKAELDTTEEGARELLEKVSAEMLMIGRVQTAVAGLEALETEVEGLDAGDARERLQALTDGYRLFDASLERYLIGDIPWSDWARPLGWWGLLVALTYMVLMAFNVLIFRQWAHHEKLTYPLAELPETLAGLNSDGTTSSKVPAVFKSGMFWVGAAVSGGFLAFNLLCATEVIPGMRPIDFKFLWNAYITKTGLEGLKPSARSEIFFTMIGLSFLIPKKISFSLWFFYVLYMLQLLVLVWFGYGVTEESFPADPWFTMNFRTAESGGALLVFGMVVLWKCRQYLFCCAKPAVLAGLEKDESQELRIASFAFLIGSVAIVLVLWQGLSANIFYAIFFFIVVLLVTVALVRAVAEGGILGFQAWANPFHFIRVPFGMQKAWTLPKFVTPLLIYYAVLFYDIKTFIAPAMANALKIRSDLKMKRWKFHVAIFACLVTAVAVAVCAELMLGYSKGANQMKSWFYDGFPKSFYERVTATSAAPAEAAAFETGWLGFGAVAMAALLFFRRMFFWLPHPIGMIMLVSPLMQAYWFSIFVGWLSKSMITKYGSKELYASAKCFFLGLIFSELVITAITIFCSVVFEIRFLKYASIGLNKAIL